MTDTPAPGRRFRFTLTHGIVAGLVIGGLLGWLEPEFAKSLKWISDLFIRLIRMLVAPLLFTTLVAGIAGIGGKTVLRLLVKAIVWFEVATTVALFIGLAAANLVHPGAGLSLGTGAAPGAAVAVGGAQLAKAKTATDFFLDLVPTSFVDAMAHNNVLQIVVFSVLLGLAVSAAGARAKPIKDLAEAGAEAVFKLVGFVMWIAPFGVGAAIAVTIGASGVAVLLPLLKLIGALYGALIVFFVLLFVATRLLTGVHMGTFLSAIREPATIAFTTASSEAALPRALQVLEGLGIPRRIVSFVVPTGYAFNLDGSTLYLALAMMFIAQAAHVDLSWGQQLTAMLFLMLSSKGVAGVPRAALVVLAGALTAFDLPAEGVALLLGIDAVMDMGRTCVNVVGNCVATVVVAVWEKAIPAEAPIFWPRGAAPRAELPEAAAYAMAIGEAPAVEPPAAD
jgi:proton glutamate symport protein